MGAVGQYGDEALLSAAGTLLANTAVTVLNPDNSHATLYTDLTGTVTTANPINTDTKGNLLFYAAPGPYQLSISGIVVGVVFVSGGFTGGTVSGTTTFTADAYFESGRPWIEVANYPGVDPTGTSDSTTGINNAETAAAALGVPLHWSWGKYKVLGSVIKKSNVAWIGPRTGQVDSSGDYTKGAWIVRTASAGVPVINATGVEFVYIDGVNINASATTDTAILYTSTNSPASHDFHYQHGWIHTQGDGIVNGSGGSEECDQLHVKDGVRIFANRCIVINSANASDGGTLGPGLTCFPIYGTNPRGIAILKGGYTTIDRVVFGGAGIANCIFIDVSGTHGPLRILQTEGEDSVTSTLHFRLASTVPPDYTNQICMEGNGATASWDFQSTCIVSSHGNSFNAAPKLSGNSILLYTDGSDTFVSPATGWIVTGTGCVIAPWPVGAGKLAWTPGLIPAGGSATVGINFTCQQGDTVDVSYDQMVTGLDISASVVGVNTVQVWLFNRSASSITPSPGNVRATTRRLAP